MTNVWLFALLWIIGADKICWMIWKYFFIQLKQKILKWNYWCGHPNNSFSCFDDFFNPVTSSVRSLNINAWKENERTQHRKLLLNLATISLNCYYETPRWTGLIGVFRYHIVFPLISFFSTQWPKMELSLSFSRKIFDVTWWYSYLCPKLSNVVVFTNGCVKSCDKNTQFLNVFCKHLLKVDFWNAKHKHNHCKNKKFYERSSRHSLCTLQKIVNWAYTSQ